MGSRAISNILSSQDVAVLWVLLSENRRKVTSDHAETEIKVGPAGHASEVARDTGRLVGQASRGRHQDFLRTRRMATGSGLGASVSVRGTVWCVAVGDFTVMGPAHDAAMSWFAALLRIEFLFMPEKFEHRNNLEKGTQEMLTPRSVLRFSRTHWVW